MLYKIAYKWIYMKRPGPKDNNYGRDPNAFNDELTAAETLAVC